MPRRNPIAQREVEICHRLKAVRVERKLSRVAFADAVGVDSSFLSNIEHARAPVRYYLAKKICLDFLISERWLATGKEPKKRYVEIHPDKEQQIPARMIFSEAYDKFLSKEIEEGLERWAVPHSFGISVKLSAIGTPRSDDQRQTISALLIDELASLPPAKHGEFLRGVFAGMPWFYRQYQDEIEKFVRAVHKKSPKVIK
ncbi:MAG: Helix-turn-helix domain [Pedosphaera sp.]|nr:Helix-turn-helix domain [Pedosphaera sp.]